MEVALLTSDRITVPYRKTRGSIVVAIPLEKIRAKWVEICGNLLAPTNRDNWMGVRRAIDISYAWQKSWATAWAETVLRRG